MYFRYIKSEEYESLAKIYELRNYKLERYMQKKYAGGGTTNAINFWAKDESGTERV